MAQCKLCHKKGLFLKLNSEGVCADCVRLADILTKEKAAESRLANKEKLIKETQVFALQEIESQIVQSTKDLQRVRLQYEEDSKKLDDLCLQIEKTTKNVELQSKKVVKLKDLYKSIEYSIKFYNEWSIEKPIEDFDKKLQDSLSPTSQIPINCLNYKDLRKKFNENDKQITLLTEQYKGRYQTKTITAMYKLMVIALRAELQNILTSMKFGGLDKAIDQIKIITAKYSQIATEGNQTIAGTLIRFIGQIEYLFIEAAKIEYEYYIQKEKIKEEQKALREQLRQEALEKRLLEQQQKQVEKEEEKYRNEIEALKTSLINAEAAKVNILNLRIQELEKHLTEVDKKKE